MLRLPVRCTRHFACSVLTLLALGLGAASATAEPGERVGHAGDTRPERPRGHLRDPIAGLVRRMDHYLQRNEVDGVTMDWRYEVSPSEEIRQTVVCQLLGYLDLLRLHPTARLKRGVVQRADFLIGRLEEIRSHSPFDGMLAYSLLGAYETTGASRCLAAGTDVTLEMLAIPTGECVLNGGLMVAMATAEYARLTGDVEARQKTSDILGLLRFYQNADGSFPHWCHGSRDIHYTGWMAMELLHLLRMTGDARIPALLSSMSAFLEGRIAPDGRSVYEQPCASGEPGCVEYFYSRAAGCGFDYDTRGWTVEPAYCALLFDHEGSAQYTPVMRFLRSLEHRGSFADLYGYWPPPSDPEYPWTIADTSAVTTSINFWAMTTALTDRSLRGEAEEIVLEDEVPLDAPRVPPSAVALIVLPNPVHGACEIRLSLPRAAEARLDVLDASGRRVRVVAEGWRAPGTHLVAWDGRDDAGHPLPSGVYFARLRAGNDRRTLRLALAR